jgi:hypothetical protein
MGVPCVVDADDGLRPNHDNTPMTRFTNRFGACGGGAGVERVLTVSTVDDNDINEADANSFDSPPKATGVDSAPDPGNVDLSVDEASFPAFVPPSVASAPGPGIPEPDGAEPSEPPRPLPGGTDSSVDDVPVPVVPDADSDASVGEDSDSDGSDSFGSDSFGVSGDRDPGPVLSPDDESSDPDDELSEPGPLVSSDDPATDRPPERVVAGSIRSARSLRAPSRPDAPCGR